MQAILDEFGSARRSSSSLPLEFHTRCEASFDRQMRPHLPRSFFHTNSIPSPPYPVPQSRLLGTALGRLHAPRTRVRCSPRKQRRSRRYGLPPHAASHTLVRLGLEVCGHRRWLVPKVHSLAAPNPISVIMFAQVHLLRLQSRLFLSGSQLDTAPRCCRCARSCPCMCMQLQVPAILIRVPQRAVSYCSCSDRDMRSAWRKLAVLLCGMRGRVWGETTDEMDTFCCRCVSCAIQLLQVLTPHSASSTPALVTQSHRRPRAQATATCSWMPATCCSGQLHCPCPLCVPVMPAINLRVAQACGCHTPHTPTLVAHRAFLNCNDSLYSKLDHGSCMQPVTVTRRLIRVHSLARGFCPVHVQSHAGASPPPPPRLPPTPCSPIPPPPSPPQGGIFHDGSERAEALDTCIATWSVLSQNYSKAQTGLDQGRLQAAAPIFAGIFQTFVDALLQHAQVGGGCESRVELLPFV